VDASAKGANQLERFLCVARFHNVVPEIPDRLGQRFTKRFVVVDDQDSRHGIRFANGGHIGKGYDEVAPEWGYLDEGLVQPWQRESPVKGSQDLRVGSPPSPQPGLS
jgi:hypothetical protein